MHETSLWIWDGLKTKQEVYCLKWLDFTIFKTFVAWKYMKLEIRNLFLKNLRGPEGKRLFKIHYLKTSKIPYPGHSSLETTLG